MIKSAFYWVGVAEEAHTTQLLHFCEMPPGCVRCVVCVCIRAFFVWRARDAQKGLSLGKNCLSLVCPTFERER